ncbi:MAG: MBL fold metallo-hydrolase, partial [Planctomycetaceae bacterium]|nr:MBL fold metallo-hydrolase [Planctomycetaceae bacterium]
IGLVSAFFVSRDELFRCTFLSVGHGLATIIELPSGQTLLYDAGTIGDGTLAERIVERALWSRGISRIDGIVISHADHDHYSGVFGLLEKFPVGTLFLTQSSVDASQEGITELCLLADAKGTNIQLVQQGDELVTDSHPDYEIELRVIHPPGGFQAKADNSHSVVLEIVCQGKRVLLTGDLEKEGFPEFFKLESRHCDVLLAPHHGGRAANVPQLYEWATPDTVIVSTNDVSRSEPLRGTIEDAELLTTRESGAISVTIEANGQLHLEEFLSRNPRNE